MSNNCIINIEMMMNVCPSSKCRILITKKKKTMEMLMCVVRTLFF